MSTDKPDFEGPWFDEADRIPEEVWKRWPTVPLAGESWSWPEAHFHVDQRLPVDLHAYGVAIVDQDGNRVAPEEFYDKTLPTRTPKTPDV